MFVTIKLPNGEEFARNKVDQVRFAYSSWEVQGFRVMYNDNEIDHVTVIVNVDNVAVVGLSQNISEEDYRQLKAYEDELDLKLNAYESLGQPGN